MSREGARHPDLSPAKREQILDGARAVFRELGYERASVDGIAARAGVSKATIYNHFRDKKALFVATFAAGTDAIRDRFLALLETPTGDIDADLRGIASQLLRLLSAPSHIWRHRIIAAEADRFPELGQTLYECGVAVGTQRLARFFERAGEMGMLEVHDPVDAAVDFGSLCTGDLSHKMHLGIVHQVTDEMIATTVDRAVRTFLRAYAPRR